MENNQINIEGIKLDEHVFEYSITKELIGRIGF